MDEQLKNLEYSELCTLLEEGVIGWVEWLEAQPDSYQGYEEWLSAEGKVKCDESAMEYIGLVEKEGMDNQMDNLMQSAWNGITAARRLNAQSMNL